MEENDHRAGRLLDDLLDQLERMGGAFPESDERDVGLLPGRHGADIGDVDLPSNHLVSKPSDDRRDERQAVLSLVRDENPEMVNLAVAHRSDDRFQV
ncbi:MAG TPA: hypothetical protein VGR41_09490 [Actinomycetota bacterium]|nr:hypothetical protein [Actinomycetota bacterium]